jgi:predicted metal-binding protein
MSKSLFDFGDEQKIKETIDTLKVSSKLIPIKYEDIVFNPLIQILCSNCGMWGRTYKCPPFSMKYDRTKEYLKQFNNFILIIAESELSEYERRYTSMKLKCPTLSQYRLDNLVGTQLAAVNLGQSQKDLKIILEFVKNKYKKYQGYGSASCLKCHPCKKSLKQPCAFPLESYSSPEASGIELYKILKNIGIKIQSPPISKYFAVCMIAYLE